MTLPLLVPCRVLAASLDILQDAGQAEHECVVLWLGIRTPAAIVVKDVYRPDQIAAEDFFRLPRESIAQLFDVLRECELMVAAQVHTHPREAFHSASDDHWAIVRHVDALSLVLPFFARAATKETFITDAAVFRLSPANEWVQVQSNELDARVQRGP